MCTWHNSTYEQNTFAPSILHPLSVITVPIHVFAAYVILFKTPSTMGSVKTSMLALHLCGAYLDILISVLSTQYLLIPAAAGYQTGLNTYLGIPTVVQEYIFFISMCLTGCTILGFFECRYNAIVRGDSGSLFGNKKRFLYIGGHVLFAVFFILPVTLNPPDQKLGKEHVKKLLPCLPDYIMNHPDLFVFSIDIALLEILVAIPITVIPTECCIFAAKIAIFLSGTRAKSKRTHKLQVQFFIALCIQISIPMTALIVPVVYNIGAFTKGYFNQALNNITLNMMALHGIISSLVMLIVHRPYRQVVTSVFCIPCSRVKKLTSSRNSQVGAEASVFVTGLQTTAVP